MLGKAAGLALALTVVALPSCSSQREDLGGASLAIVGGTADTDHAAVMAAGHQVGAGQFCSAYLITPDLVLTAHHCTADPALLPSTVCTPNALLPPSLSPSTLLVVGGPSSSTSTSLYSVAKVHNLPDLASRTLCGNDVAVLQLSKPISGVEPLGLRLNAPPEQDEELTLVGYGQTSLSDPNSVGAVSYTHLRAHETVLDLVCRLLLEKKKNNTKINTIRIQTRITTTAYTSNTQYTELKLHQHNIGT